MPLTKAQKDEKCECGHPRSWHKEYRKGLWACSAQNPFCNCTRFWPKKMKIGRTQEITRDGQRAQVCACCHHNLEEQR